MAINQEKIRQCELVKILGVTECNNCPHIIECWGEETQLPEPPNNKGISSLVEVLQEIQHDNKISNDRLGRFYRVKRGLKVSPNNK